MAGMSPVCRLCQEMCDAAAGTGTALFQYFFCCTGEIRGDPMLNEQLNSVSCEQRADKTQISKDLCANHVVGSVPTRSRQGDDTKMG